MVEGWLENQTSESPAEGQHGQDAHPVTGLVASDSRKETPLPRPSSSGQSNDSVRSLVAQLRADKPQGSSSILSSSKGSPASGGQAAFGTLDDDELSQKALCAEKLRERQERERQSLRQRQRAKGKHDATRKASTGRARRERERDPARADSSSVGEAAKDAWGELCELDVKQQTLFQQKLEASSAAAVGALSSKAAKRKKATKGRSAKATAVDGSGGSKTKARVRGALEDLERAEELRRAEFHAKLARGPVLPSPKTA